MNAFVRFILGTPAKAPVHQVSAHKRANLEREIIKQESRIGAALLGPIPEGHTREFFYLGNNIWVWDEQWYDAEKKVMQQLHVQYEFQTRGVLKTVNGTAHGYVEGKELKNLVAAIRTYKNQVSNQLYGQPA